MDNVKNILGCSKKAASLVSSSDSLFPRRCRLLKVFIPKQPESSRLCGSFTSAASVHHHSLFWQRLHLPLLRALSHASPCLLEPYDALFLPHSRNLNVLNDSLSCMLYSTRNTKCAVKICTLKYYKFSTGTSDVMAKRVLFSAASLWCGLMENKCRVWRIFVAAFWEVQPSRILRNGFGVTWLRVSG